MIHLWIDVSSKFFFMHSDNPCKRENAPTLVVSTTENKIERILPSWKTTIHHTFTTRYRTPPHAPVPHTITVTKPVEWTCDKRHDVQQYPNDINRTPCHF
ncbi:hypothetical protein AVEN_222722-1 [Araneus ventricosus]|uniref:Uncharacterized protein n=1 Tax=Araneus ventricosus TaxID=182803 RepID=A0A4Y2B1D3_ARAVE|nr:hypothetical protein AVEN_222722-1 [Araneus ventricosus]